MTLIYQLFWAGGCPTDCLIQLVSFWWGNHVPNKVTGHVFMINWWVNRQVRMSSQNRTSGSQTSVHYALNSPFLDEKIGDKEFTPSCSSKTNMVIGYLTLQIFFPHLKLYSSNSVQFSLRKYSRKILCLLCWHLMKCFK